MEQQQLTQFIYESIPELGGICKDANCSTPYHFARQMILYINAQILRSNTNGAQICLQLAEEIHKAGNNIIKNAIENVFVFSLTYSFFQDAILKKKLLEILPDSLYDIYRKQVICSHL